MQKYGNCIFYKFVFWTPIGATVIFSPDRVRKMFFRYSGIPVLFYYQPDSCLLGLPLPGRIG